MPDLHDPRRRRHRAARPPLSARPVLAPLDLAAPDTFGPWLAALRDQLDDALAAGEDATRSPSRRDLGRRMARRILLEARASLAVLIADADRAVAGTAPRG